MTKRTPMTRWKASAVHLTLSVLILGTLAALLIWRWYPPGLFQMARAGKLLLLVAVVDVVIGPLLTLIVYKHGKKTLRFDLTVIALLQVAAMAYGLHTMWESRPVYLVANPRYFDLVFANEIDPADLASAPSEYRTLPFAGARVVGVSLPEGSEERDRALQMAMSGKDAQFVPGFYRPYGTVAPQMLAQATPIAAWLAKLSPDEQQTIHSAIEASGRSADDLALVPVFSTRGGAAMLLDKADGRVVSPVAVDLTPDE